MEKDIKKTVNTIVCDYCDTEINRKEFHSDRRCTICGKDICRKHRHDITPPHNIQWDSRYILCCKDCYKTLKPYSDTVSKHYGMLKKSIGKLCTKFDEMNGGE